jgi:nicotinamidase-related amidase
MAATLRFGPLSRCAHLCVDMQKLFAEGTDWATPWLPRVVPNIRRIAERHRDETVFTRFIPASRPGNGIGSWRRYYMHWPEMTLERLGSDMIDLVPELAEFAPPAALIDKHVYSPWMAPELRRLLRRRRVHTLVVTGGETEVCVLATVLGAVDHGFRVVVAADALCSSADETHDALMAVYRRRFGQQVETAETEEILDAWR